MKNVKWSEKLTNEQVLEHIGEKRTLLNYFLRRKANWICRILRRNCLLHDAIKGQMTEVKGVGRRRTQLPIRIPLGVKYSPKDFVLK